MKKGILVVIAAAAFASALPSPDEAAAPQDTASPQETVTAAYPKSKITGKWSLGTKGSPRFQLNPNSTFSFVGWGNSSKGTWSYDGATLQLIWTHVDGSKVTAGTVRGKYPVSAEGILRIDKFSYRRGIQQ